ncbi:protein kinase [Blastopirellula sp. JC732]|uniref:Protein kinase n=1 Tax=Blastopirellula sediminis TaxID=2894196 RepID=A0A9X1SGF2_9BACT|nr:serine/threonine-protein kinase [Blastopirellula sediminis]MCC9608592.1 protein kinase [Blastopirellula sediminis]MCC9628631.1 protein kinase [Blastopirellula sediminis]
MSGSKGKLQALGKIDAICDQFEQAWSVKSPANPVDFVADLSGEDRRAALAELFLLDHELRLKFNLNCSIQYYRERFPAEQSVIEGLAQELEATLPPSQGSDLVSTRHIFFSPGDEGIPVTSLSEGMIVGNCEIIRELGRGGMGVVFLARQLSAHRNVALKIVRPDYIESLTESDRESLIDRFQNEVIAATRVEHPNVIAIYEVGKFGSSPYFTMQFAAGEALSRKLRKGPLDSETAARYLLQVAHGVYAAHQRNILHRDLNPRNILFDDASDRALVADFGLAKLLDGALTRTNDGALMGSPPYMAPEQVADSANVTTAADVYGLGATLYHMLTGRPPFLAASPSATLYQVVNDHPVLPRELNQSLARDIETICMKCLHKEPRMRYTSVAALADDLQRFLDNRPIVARPISSMERLWRWCLLNQGTAIVFVCIMTLLTIACLIASNRYIVASRNQILAEQRQAESLRYFQLTSQLAEETVEWISQDPRLRAHGLEEARRVQLERAARCYEQLALIRSEDPELLESQAAAFLQLGKINLNLQEFSKAEVALRQSLRVLDSIVDSSSVDPRISSEAYATLGDVLLNVGKLEDAEASYLLARTQREASLAKNPTDRQAIIDVAKSLSDSGRILETREAFVDAEREYESAIALFQSETMQSNRTHDEYLAQAKLQSDLARVLARQERLEESVSANRTAQQIAQELLRALDRDPDVQELIVACQNNLADLFQRLGRSEEAENEYLAVIQTLRQMTTTHPDVDYYGRNLALTQHNLASVYMENDKLEEARQQQQLAIDLLASLVQKRPESIDFRHHLSRAQLLLANILLSLDQAAEAIATLGFASEELEQLSHDHPDVVDFQRDRAQCYGILANIRLDESDFVEAKRLLQSALTALQFALDSPDCFEAKQDVAALYVRLGGLDLMTDDISAATAEFQKASALYANLRETGDSVYLQQADAITHQNLSRLYFDREEWTKATEHAAQSIQLLESLHQMEGGENFADDLLDEYCYLTTLPTESLRSAALNKGSVLVTQLVESDASSRYAAIHWQMYTKLAEGALQKDGDRSAALQHYSTALVIADRFCQANPQDENARHRLFRVYQARGRIQTEMGKLDNALADLKQAVKYADDASSQFAKVQLACGLARLKQWTEADRIAGELVASTDSQSMLEMARFHCLAAAGRNKETSARTESHLQQAIKTLTPMIQHDDQLSKTLESDDEFSVLLAADVWKSTFGLKKE